MSEDSVAENVVNELTESNPQEGGAEQAEAERTVPLTALEAERKKRQEAEYKVQLAEQYHQQYIQQSQSTQKSQDDDEDDYTKQIKQSIRNEVNQELQQKMEQMYVAQNPQVVERINKELEPILKKRPRLAELIKTSENRYAAAMEIIEDYSPKLQPTETERKLEENAKKPGSPQGLGKGSKMTQQEMVRSMSSDDFHRYRRQMRGR
jgi:hypothetical protein